MMKNTLNVGLGLKLRYLRTSHTQRLEISQGVRTHLTHLVWVRPCRECLKGGELGLLLRRLSEEKPAINTTFISGNIIFIVLSKNSLHESNFYLSKGSIIFMNRKSI